MKGEKATISGIIKELVQRYLSTSEQVEKVTSTQVSKATSEQVSKKKGEIKEWKYEPATQKQINYLKDLIKKVAKIRNITEDEVMEKWNINFETLTKEEASELINFFTDMIKEEEK